MRARSALHAPAESSAVVAVLLVAFAGSARAQSMQVTHLTASANHALELRVGEPGPTAVDAYVAIGPDRGLRADTALTVAFDLDLGSVVATQPAALPFLRLSESREPDGARVVVFLQSAPGGWLVGAWARERTGRLALAGRAPLPLRRTADGAMTARLELEWTAASSEAGDSRGRLSLSVIGPDEERNPLIANDGLDNAGQVVNGIQLGVLAADRLRGVSGRLLLDDVAVHRPSPPPQP